MNNDNCKKTMLLMNIIILLALAECEPTSKKCLENYSSCTTSSACCSKLCHSRVYPLPIRKCIPKVLVCTQQNECCSKYCVAVGLMNQLCMSISDPNQPEKGKSSHSVTPRSENPGAECKSTGSFCSTNNECCSQLCVSIGYNSIKACVNSTVTVGTIVKNSFNSTITILNGTLDYCTPNNDDCDDFSRCCAMICSPIGFTGIDLCIYLPINKTWTMDLPSSSVTSIPDQNSNYCVLNGHYCVEDYDCCSEKCHSIWSTKLHACVDP